jgi:hypothetical protein
MSPKRSEQKQEHKGRQQQTTQDFRPERQAKHSGKRVDKPAEKGGQPRHAEVQTEPVGEKRAQEMQKDEIPIQRAQRKWVIPGRVGQKERPVKRVRGADDFAKKRLAAPQVRVPERKLVIAPRDSLKLQTRHIHLNYIRVIDPGILAGECQLPAKPAANEEQKGWAHTVPTKSAKPPVRAAESL